jgi:hypothetical protein
MKNHILCCSTLRYNDEVVLVIIIQEIVDEKAQLHFTWTVNHQIKCVHSVNHVRTLRGREFFNIVLNCTHRIDRTFGKSALVTSLFFLGGCSFGFTCQITKTKNSSNNRIQQFECWVMHTSQFWTELGSQLGKNISKRRDPYKLNGHLNTI